MKIVDKFWNWIYISEERTVIFIAIVILIGFGLITLHDCLTN